MNNILLNQYKINNDLEYDFKLLSQRINSSYEILISYIPKIIKLNKKIKMINCDVIGFTHSGKVVIQNNNKKIKKVIFNDMFNIEDRLVIYLALKKEILGYLEIKLN